MSSIKWTECKIPIISIINRVSLKFPFADPKAWSESLVMATFLRPRGRKRYCVSWYVEFNPNTIYATDYHEVWVFHTRLRTLIVTSDVSARQSEMTKTYFSIATSSMQWNELINNHSSCDRVMIRDNCSLWFTSTWVRIRRIWRQSTVMAT